MSLQLGLSVNSAFFFFGYRTWSCSNGSELRCSSLVNLSHVVHTVSALICFLSSRLSFHSCSDVSFLKSAPLPSLVSYSVNRFTVSLLLTVCSVWNAVNRSFSIKPCGTAAEGGSASDEQVVWAQLKLVTETGERVNTWVDFLLIQVVVTLIIKMSTSASVWLSLFIQMSWRNVLWEM